MSTLVALYSTFISSYALTPCLEKRSAILSSLEHAALLPNCKKILLLLCKEDVNKIDLNNADISFSDKVKVVGFENVTAFNILTECVKEAGECTDAFIAPLEAPFIDIEASHKLYDQHTRYKAEYTFAEGYPEFLLPQVLNIGLCKILSAFVKDNPSTVEHDFIFEIIKKDINSYDIETFIAPEDARMLKLKFVVETKRDLQLCQNFIGITATNYIEMLKSSPLKLKTLPRYYMIEIAPKRPCESIYRPPLPQVCTHMTLKDFCNIIEKIAQFSDDAIISLSLYGDPLEHPQFTEFLKAVSKYPNLSILIETFGLSKDAKLKIDDINKIIKNRTTRKTSEPNLYWITCIDATSGKTYAKVHNVTEENGEALLKKAYETAEYAYAILKDSSYVQIVRMNENEEELEGFYRSWKERGHSVIIQKYDHFCSCLPERRVADLSPLKRMPCRHLNRELCILSNGDVIFCHEDIKCTKIMGNVLTMNLDDIWQRFDSPCLEQSALNFGGLCELCDEYYTYNF